MASKQKWSPDESFREKEGDGDYKGVQRVKKVLDRLGLDPRKKIYTSRDPAIIKATAQLLNDTMPPGFKQTQLPILMGMDGEPVLCFMTIGEPNAKLPPHRHEKDSLLRFVINGSIYFGNRWRLAASLPKQISLGSKNPLDIRFVLLCRIGDLGNSERLAKLCSECLAAGEWQGAFDADNAECMNSQDRQDYARATRLRSLPLINRYC